MNTKMFNLVFNPPGTRNREYYIAVLGEAADVTNYIKQYNETFSLELEAEAAHGDWGLKGDPNPAFSENHRGSSPNTKKGGSWMAIDAAEIKPTSSDINESVGKSGGLIINHEAGHLAGLDHMNKLGEVSKKPEDLGFTDSPIMKEGNSLNYTVQGRGYDFVTSNNTMVVKSRNSKSIRTMQNQDYRVAIKSRFGGNDGSINYNK